MLSAVITSRRSQPAVPLAGQLAHQRSVRPGPLVLGTALLKSPARAADRDRTVSRRSKPSSRTALIGEQPNPWDLLQPQDATSRHRGAKPCRGYGLLGKISLLSPGYLFAPPFPFGRQPPQLNSPPDTVPGPDHGPRLDTQNDQSGISPVTPPRLASGLPSLPPILHKPSRTPMSSCSKGPGVFPSCCAKRASLLVVQFRRACG